MRAFLEAQGQLMLSCKGQSMLPTLAEGDVVKLVPVDTSELQPGDIAAVACFKEHLPATMLIRVPGGGPIHMPVIVHRVIRLLAGRKSLVIWGDNCLLPDYGVSAQNVLGKVVAVVSDGQERLLERETQYALKRSKLLWLLWPIVSREYRLRRTSFGRICRRLLTRLLVFSP